MRSKVAVLRTSPESVLEDYGRLMRMAGYQSCLQAGKKTFLKLNMAWREWYPASSTEPWQLEGVIKTLVDDGYMPGSIVACDGSGKDFPFREAAGNNGLATVTERYGAELWEIAGKKESWVPFVPESGLTVLDQLVGDEGILVPESFLGNNIIHLPTVKTHPLTRVAGSAMSAFDALLEDQWLKAGVHAILADLLALQKELCPGIFTVSDGTLCGDGPGPRMLIPYEKDLILAGADPVAVDAVTARMMGFDPMQIDYIRMATERGIGNGEASQIELAGDDISDVDFHFTGGRQPRLPTTDFFLEYYWYPYRGWPHVGRIAETSWGQMLQDYLPEGSELDRQGKGKGPLLALTAAAAIFGVSAARRVAAAVRRGA